MAERKKEGPLTDKKEALKRALTPVWFDLPEKFWRELSEIAEETGLKPAELIARGIKLCLKEHRGQLRPQVKLPKGEWINAEWLRTKTPEERSEMARHASLKRWGKDDAKKSKLPDEPDPPAEETKKLNSP